MRPASAARRWARRRDAPRSRAGPMPPARRRRTRRGADDDRERTSEDDDDDLRQEARSPQDGMGRRRGSAPPVPTRRVDRPADDRDQVHRDRDGDGERATPRSRRPVSPSVTSVWWAARSRSSQGRHDPRGAGQGRSTAHRASGRTASQTTTTAAATRAERGGIRAGTVREQRGIVGRCRGRLAVRSGQEALVVQELRVAGPLGERLGPDLAVGVHVVAAGGEEPRRVDRQLLVRVEDAGVLGDEERRGVVRVGGRVLEAQHGRPDEPPGGVRVGRKPGSRAGEDDLVEVGEAVVGELEVEQPDAALMVVDNLTGRNGIVKSGLVRMSAS